MFGPAMYKTPPKPHIDF